MQYMGMQPIPLTMTYSIIKTNIMQNYIWATLRKKRADTLRATSARRHSGLDPESPQSLEKDWGTPGQARDDDADACWFLMRQLF